MLLVAVTDRLSDTAQLHFLLLGLVTLATLVVPRLYTVDGACLTMQVTKATLGEGAGGVPRTTVVLETDGLEVVNRRLGWREWNL